MPCSKCSFCKVQKVSQDYIYRVPVCSKRGNREVQFEIIEDRIATKVIKIAKLKPDTAPKWCPLES